jgi:hypothetical protein
MLASERSESEVVKLWVDEDLREEGRRRTRGAGDQEGGTAVFVTMAESLRRRLRAGEGEREADEEKQGLRRR